LRDSGSEIRGLADNAPQFGHEWFAYEKVELQQEGSTNDFARSTGGIWLQQVADVEVRIKENAHGSLSPGGMCAAASATLFDGSDCHLISFFGGQVPVSFRLLRHDAVEAAEKLTLCEFLLSFEKQLIFRVGDENRRRLIPVFDYNCISMLGRGLEIRSQPVLGFGGAYDFGFHIPHPNH